MADTPAQRAALRTDKDLIEQFLRERCARSAHTYASYEAQLRRLGWFCRHIGLHTVRALQREQWPDFETYLRSPPPEHVMLASVAYGHPSWAPFRKALSQRSATQAQLVVRSFYAWLADPAIGAIAINPVQSVRTHIARRSATRNGVERFITEREMAFIDQSIAQLPGATLELVRTKARARWVVDLAVLTGLRASEIAAACVGMIKPAAATGGTTGGYCLHITRKGGVDSALPLLREVLESHRRYMALYADTWVAREPAGQVPLVLTVRLNSKRPDSPDMALNRSHIWRIFKDVMINAADLARQEGDEACAERLVQASTHWMRHTFGTRLLDAGADIRSVRDLMDHGSISTTNQYLHRPAEKLRGDIEMLVRERRADLNQS